MNGGKKGNFVNEMGPSVGLKLSQLHPPMYGNFHFDLSVSPLQTSIS
jgi:hypothetical protein